MASSCSCSIKARVCASAWPPGDSRSTELKMVSRSSSRSEASMSLSKAWATFASTLACCMRSHSCSFKVCTWIIPHRYETERMEGEIKTPRERDKKTHECTTDTSNCHCYLHHTDLHVADVQSGSKQKETEKKKIIRENLKIKRVEEGKRHTVQIRRVTRKTTKIK